ncbi:MAG: GntR family transcriptional regulator [Lachnospiraceae bacterium]|nr:GntR family transcriptional regulator [Lachnospiraceae bacterium]
MIILDLKDARPLYEQVVDRFKHLILCGVLQEDEKLPSVRNLAMELSINPNTIQKAFTELEREGFIYSVKGRGNFVASNGILIEHKKKELEQQIEELVKEAEGIGMSIEDIIEFLTKLK